MRFEIEHEKLRWKVRFEAAPDFTRISLVGLPFWTIYFQKEKVDEIVNHKTNPIDNEKEVLDFLVAEILRVKKLQAFQ